MTASSTTPLISTIFPVFLPLLLSATGSPLDKGRATPLAGGRKAPALYPTRLGAPRWNRPRLRSLRDGRDRRFRDPVHRSHRVDSQPAEPAPRFPPRGAGSGGRPARGRRRGSGVGDPRPRVVRARLAHGAVDRGRRRGRLAGP